MKKASNNHPDGVEIRVSEADTKNLTMLSRSDIFFAILYSLLFIWGLVLTLISI